MAIPTTGYPASGTQSNVRLAPAFHKKIQVTSPQQAEHTISDDCLPWRAVSVPHVAFNRQHPCPLHFLKAAQRPPPEDKACQPSLCQPSPMASAAAGLHPSGPAAPCTPRRAPQGRTRRAALPQDVYQKIPEREAGQEAEARSTPRLPLQTTFSEQCTQKTSMGGTTRVDQVLNLPFWFVTHRGWKAPLDVGCVLACDIHDK